ncbi:hypothetical protein J3D56_002200 [Erwinia persicina]|jgi:hypothetical protein|nr:hypothetical protein [Erwinia persicina]
MKYNNAITAIVLFFVALVILSSGLLMIFGH